MPPDLTNTTSLPVPLFCRPEGGGDTKALLVILIVLAGLWFFFKWIKKTRNKRK